jgi:aspartate aminotransferase
MRLEAPGYSRSGLVDVGEIDLALGEARFAWPDDLLATLISPSTAQMRYQNPLGLPQLRMAYLAKAASAQLQERQLDLANVLVTSGAKQALWLAFLVSVKDDSRVLLPRPGWPPYVAWTRACGGEIDWYDPTDISGSAPIQRLSSGEFTHLVINSPHNPTGCEYSQSVVDRIADAAEAFEVTIISDEVYRCFATGEASFVPHVSPKSGCVLVADSVSKSAGAAGLRVGFLIANESVVSSAAFLRGTVDSCPPGITQSAATLLLSPRSDRFRVGVRSFAQECVKRLIVVLRKDGISIQSSGALYVWACTKSDDGRLYLRDGSVLRGLPGSTFGESACLRLCPVSDDPQVAALLDMGQTVQEFMV